MGEEARNRSVHDESRVASIARRCGIGVPANAARAFLRNRWFTPSLQTALVAAVDRLHDATGRDTIIRTAATIAGEVPARFLLRSLVVLADDHGREAPLKQIRMRGIVPIGTGNDGSLVAAAAVDYLYWNQEAAAFAKAKELASARRVLLLTGEASPRALSEFSRFGWTVRVTQHPLHGG